MSSESSQSAPEPPPPYNARTPLCGTPEHELVLMNEMAPVLLRIGRITKEIKKVDARAMTLLEKRRAAAGAESSENTANSVASAPTQPAAVTNGDLDRIRQATIALSAPSGLEFPELLRVYAGTAVQLRDISDDLGVKMSEKLLWWIEQVEEVEREDHGEGGATSTEYSGCAG
ncbi:hypothetical protein MKEN_00846200 [Mycena kentingensis (nom. inval.)]|nr:hypothetical protein MKEN_00846200 [Mycena kentingensis (nom. inval.)]